MAAISSTLSIDAPRGLSVLRGRCIVVPRCEEGGLGRPPFSWVICSVFKERINLRLGFCKYQT